MAAVYFRCVPFDKSAVTLALESGVDGVIVPGDQVDAVAGLSRCEVWADDAAPLKPVQSKSDEEAVLALLRQGQKAILAEGWEIIPVENLLAQSDAVLAEVENPERARLACGILERGVAGVVVPAASVSDLKEIIAQCKLSQGTEDLRRAIITSVRRVGLGHRVCLDTMTLLHRGQGMLVGNSSAFTFLVHAETEHNEYVAARPFRVNAGAAHAYIILPGDKTSYLGELKNGDELLVVDWNGETSLATLGRVKTEMRPMLQIEAQVDCGNGEKRTGSVFLQNAETIRLTSPAGDPISVVKLQPGDEVLCRLDEAGRHFGMRVKEDIREG